MSNRLAAELSPYLLQHKDNPVDWRPWGEEAFRTARETNRPILLSIGYSTCHWCHVMERESFTDPAVAALMNAEFVCVKLDREERPDVDRQYMEAVQAIRGQGGWPLNVFLTPELRPFYGGTYFPPAPRWGQPSWRDVLARIASLWKERRDDVVADAGRLSAAVATRLESLEGNNRRASPQDMDAAEEAFRAGYDEADGGFGSAPKFPLPSILRFLLGRPAGADMAVATLRAMVRGGIFDHLGGGFHRYSTDALWRVPHFEKMLYDNAQLLEILALAVARSPDAELTRALRATADYILRDLRAPDGGFYSAEDADSLPARGGEAEEGAFYLWERVEIEQALGKKAESFCARYGVESGGNAVFDPHGELRGRNVLYERDVAAMADDDAAAARVRLRTIRDGRPRPSLDDKCLASWNGLALSGLSCAYRAVGDASYLKAAHDCADFLRREMCESDGRTLYRRWRAGRRAVEGFAEDYAFVARGLLDLYEADFQPWTLAWAAELADQAILQFAAPEGGLRQASVEQSPELFARAVETHDGVEPSASAVLCDVALRLAELTGRGEFRTFAEKTLERFGPLLGESPTTAPFMLCALRRALATPRLVVVAFTEKPGGRELIAAARAKLAARAGMVLAGFRAETREATAAILPAVGSMKPGPRAAAYVCTGHACGTPVDSPIDLNGLLEGR